MGGDAMKAGKGRPRSTLHLRAGCLLLVVSNLLGPRIADADVVRLDDVEGKTMTPEELVRHREAPLIKHDTGMQLGCNEISNLVYTHGAKRVDVRSRPECEDACDNHHDCKSYSYRAGDKRCIWSSKPMKWSTRWKLFIKQTEMNDAGQMVPTGKWTGFDMVGYLDKDSADKSSGLFTKRTVDLAGCKELCMNLKQCGSISYKDFDESCVMGDDGIQFNENWLFFPKNNRFTSKKNTDKPPDRLGESTDMGDYAPVSAPVKVEEGKTTAPCAPARAG